MYKRILTVFATGLEHMDNLLSASSTQLYSSSTRRTTYYVYNEIRIRVREISETSPADSESLRKLEETLSLSNLDLRTKFLKNSVQPLSRWCTARVTSETVDVSFEREDTSATTTLVRYRSSGTEECCV